MLVYSQWWTYLTLYMYNCLHLSIGDLSTFWNKLWTSSGLHIVRYIELSCKLRSWCFIELSCELRSWCFIELSCVLRSLCFIELSCVLRSWTRWPSSWVDSLPNRTTWWWTAGGREGRRGRRRRAMRGKGGSRPPTAPCLRRRAEDPCQYLPNVPPHDPTPPKVSSH